jgi:hypothetical protein
VERRSVRGKFIVCNVGVGLWKVLSFGVDYVQGN